MSGPALEPWAGALEMTPRGSMGSIARAPSGSVLWYFRVPSGGDGLRLLRGTVEGTWERVKVQAPSVKGLPSLATWDGVFRMWWSAGKIVYSASSEDGIYWPRARREFCPEGPGLPGSDRVAFPDVSELGGRRLMTYVGWPSGGVMVAEQERSGSWRRGQMLLFRGGPGADDEHEIMRPKLVRIGEEIHLVYVAGALTAGLFDSQGRCSGSCGRRRTHTGSPWKPPGASSRRGAGSPARFFESGWPRTSAAGRHTYRMTAPYRNSTRPPLPCSSWPLPRSVS